MCDDREDGYVSKYLTHFVGGNKPDMPRKTEEESFDLLCKIIRDRKLLPRGSEENWAGNLEAVLGKALSSNEAFIPEMVCFCDIPLNNDMLMIHAKKFSAFGLAFDKAWLARNRGASPVFYLAQGSCCTDHRFPNGHPCRGTTRKAFFDLAAHDWLMELRSRNVGCEEFPRCDNMFLWYVLSYCKFFDEAKGKDDQDNYYLEREWRTIGQVPFDSDDIKKILLPARFKKRLLEEFPRENGFEKKVRVMDSPRGSGDKMGSGGHNGDLQSSP
jgi:hypothetical protein